VIRATRTRLLSAAAAVIAVAVVVPVVAALSSRAEAPSFKEQACSLPPAWLERTLEGYSPDRSGQIQLLPRTPAYFSSGAGGWSHSGPWPYLQDVPIVFYGPGLIPARGAIERPVTMADIAPTLARLMGGSFATPDGKPLPEVATVEGSLRPADRPKLIVTVVYDGGGWNVLNQWPGDWPVLKMMMEEGTAFTDATVGSSPSVTPSVHTTLGTGVFPARHGITDIPVFVEDGAVVDAFLGGESSRLMKVPALAERWDEANANRANIGMVGYEPWHLGMIGQGAEKPGGDKDDAVWLDIDTNEWISDSDSYTLPDAVASAPGLEADVAALDAADGERDGAWGEHAILEDPARLEETPAFIAYHTRAMLDLIEAEGYGDDSITDLMFTNYKQIDRVGHYFNMASDEVRDSLAATDEQVGVIIDTLNREVGRGEWAMVLTADHGQQPDAGAVNGYGIDPLEVVEDIDDRFGPITKQVRPTQVFLYPDALEEQEVEVDEVARFLSDYRLADSTIRPDTRLGGAGAFGPQDRIFDLAVPSKVLPTIRC